MRFYEMIDISNDDNLFETEIFKKLPSAIKEKIKRINKKKFGNVNIKNENKSLLNNIWKLTTELCINYVDKEWINEISIDKDELINDIKNHCIFIILLSIKDKKRELKSIENNLLKYYNSNIEIKDTYDKFKRKFKKKWVDWIEEVRPNVWYREHINFKFKDYNYIDIEKSYINADFDVLYNMIDGWQYSPFNIKNLYGSTFDELLGFYNKLMKFENKNGIETIEKNFLIERYFSINLIFEIYSTITSRCFPKINECDISTLGYVQTCEAQRLFYLAKIASMPLVFSRSKYINKIDEEYEKKYGKLDSINIFEGRKYIHKLEVDFFYVNNYLIPLMLQTYYILLQLYINNSIILGKDQRIVIFEKILTTYINDKSEVYNIKKLGFNKKYFNKEDYKALQMNLINVIYGFCGKKGKLINNYENIFDIMKEKEIELDEKPISKSMIYRSKSRYYEEYPFNQVYSSYKNLCGKQRLYMENEKAKIQRLNKG